jgi:hypothetical protein
MPISPQKHLKNIFCNVSIFCGGQYASTLCQPPLTIYHVKWHIKFHLNHNIQLFSIHGVVHVQWWSVDGDFIPHGVE